MFRTTDIKNIEDKGDFYHLEFNAYDYESLLPKPLPLNWGSLERMYYGYILLEMGDNGISINNLNDCVFFVTSDISFNENKCHLKIPKNNNSEVINTFINGNYSYEIYIETNGNMSLVLSIIDNRLKRANKLKKIKDKIKK